MATIELNGITDGCRSPGHGRDHGELYNRKIGLTLAGTSVVVEWGICLVNFRFFAKIRDEILAASSGHDPHST
jgi:hypothetical protein